MLAYLYRFLSAFKTQDGLTEDMRKTFEEARTDARARGWWAYARFSVREIGGLFGVPLGRRWWVRAVGWAVVGSAAGWLASVVMPARYTSEATLRMTPAVVSQDLLPRDSVSVESVLDSVAPVALSRGAIMLIVDRLGLYPNMRHRVPAQEIAEEFRKSMRIERSGANLIRITFTYSDWPSGEADAALSQKVTQEMVSRIIDESIRERSTLAYATTQFFKDYAEELEKTWTELNERARATPVSSPQYAALARSLDQKRKALEGAEQKYAEAKELMELYARKVHKSLELLDPASLPEQPDTSPWMIRIAGMGLGLAMGAAVAMWRSLRRPSLAFPFGRASETA
jgi:uncharacterized protein involved in exopolysaccharide biosynthesis